MKGGPRRTKSEAQRLQDGSRKRPHQHPQAQIQAACERPKLSAPQRRYWDYYAPLLEQARMLSAGDREALRLYCIALAQVDDIEQQQAATEYRRVMLTVTVDGAGNEKIKAETNPLDAQLRMWIEIARHHAAELGLSPASRTRVAPVGKPDTEKPSALAALQARANVVSIKRA